MREDGAAFDRFIITLDQSMNMGDAPSEGPAESGRASATARNMDSVPEKYLTIRPHVDPCVGCGGIGPVWCHALCGIPG